MWRLMKFKCFIPYQTALFLSGWSNLELDSAPLSQSEDTGSQVSVTWFYILRWPFQMSPMLACGFLWNVWREKTAVTVLRSNKLNKWCQLYALCSQRISPKRGWQLFFILALLKALFLSHCFSMNVAGASCLQAFFLWATLSRSGQKQCEKNTLQTIYEVRHQFARKSVAFIIKRRIGFAVLFHPLHVQQIYRDSGGMLDLAQDRNPAKSAGAICLYQFSRFRHSKIWFSNWGPCFAIKTSTRWIRCSKFSRFHFVESFYQNMNADIAKSIVVWVFPFMHPFLCVQRF